jgi:hypothetical protein
MLGASRVILFVAGLAMVVGGLAIIASGESGAWFGGIILIGCSVPLFVGAAWENARYRARENKGLSSPYGPGGVPPTETLEPRFRATSEVFIDPSTGTRMRVYADASSGERRYRAEG